METTEIPLEKLNPTQFIEKQTQHIKKQVGDHKAINALSGGVDSSTVTLLGHKALNSQLTTYLIDNGIMRQNEPQHITNLFKKIGVPVQLIDARAEFMKALKGVTDPEEKREAITQTFYRDIFSQLIKKSKAKYLLQGTIYTDIEETLAGVKRQHNVLEQLGINTQETYGYKIIEPLIQLRKPAVRKIAETLGLPQEIYDRPPFPGPALAARIIGEVTAEKIDTIRKATFIVEETLENTNAFQYMAILHEDKVTGIRGGKRDYGNQIEIRCWDSLDAKTGTPTQLPHEILFKLADRITTEVKGVVSVTYNITCKPPSTIEAV